MHLKSPAMLTVLPLQDWLAMDGELRRENPHDERINVPANSRHYWRYRMHITLEELLKAENINKLIRHKIAESGR
jgi:4-alpha-glucanotransferase